MMIYSCSNRYLLALVLMLSGQCYAQRNPFLPPHDISCLNVQPAAPLWQLRGIVGQPGDYRAWLVSPQGKGKLWGKGQKPDARWQLSQLDALGITVMRSAGCTTPLKMMLRRDIYANEKDFISSDPATPSPGAMQ